MDIPTYERPSITLSDGPLYIVRGISAYDPKTGKIEVVGCFDGPLIKLQGPHGEPLVMSVEFVPRLIEALQAAITPPTCAPHTYDAELSKMGLKLLPV